MRLPMRVLGCAWILWGAANITIDIWAAYSLDIDVAFIWYGLILIAGIVMVIGNSTARSMILVYSVIFIAAILLSFTSIVPPSSGHRYYHALFGGQWFIPELRMYLVQIGGLIFYVASLIVIARTRVRNAV